MVNYKLHYFDVCGRAEPIRMMFALCGEKYEDRRFTYAEWETIKKEPIFLFGQAPVLEVDGKPLPQTFAIMRYLGNKLGFSGDSDFEKAQVDALLDYYNDHFMKVLNYYLAHAGYKEGDKEALYKSELVPERDIFLKKLTEFIDNNETHSGYLVGDSVTFADLYLLNHVIIFEGFHKGYAEGFPKILALCDKIKEMPKMKEYLAARPPRNI